MGAALVALMGLLGRRASDSERVGLIAAGITAVYPLLVVLDGSLRSESLYAPLIALVLLLAYERRPILLGIAIGLATLTRSEALLLLPLLLPLAVPRGGRLKVTLACALTLAPWVARNTVEFDRPLLSTNSGSLEGTIDLAAVFGSVPTNIYLCSAAYQTADGGALSGQCPAGSGPDIDTNEFLCIPTAALRDFNTDGKFDRIDPAIDFRILNAQITPGGCAVSWAAMPGRSYQVLCSDSLNGPWTNVPGGSNNAGFQELYLSYTDAPPSTSTQRFYKIKILP